jgi:hypothetical protein
MSGSQENLGLIEKLSGTPCPDCTSISYSQPTSQLLSLRISLALLLVFATIAGTSTDTGIVVADAAAMATGEVDTYADNDESAD